MGRFGISLKKKVLKLWSSIKSNKEFLVSIAATLISLLAIYMANQANDKSDQANDIARQVRDMNIEPNLDVYFIVDFFGNNSPSINLYNNGANPIYEIHINIISLNWNLTTKQLTAEVPWEKDWQYIEELKPKHKEEYVIDNKIIESTYSMLKAVYPAPEGEVYAVLEFRVNYRRMPDQKLYDTTKYLLIITSAKDGSPIPVNLYRNRLPFQEIRKSLELYELKN